MAIKLEYRNGYTRAQGVMARKKVEQILAVLCDEPLTAMEIAEKTGLAEPTVRHHLHTMEKREQLTAAVMKKVTGDNAKRYFTYGTDITNIKTTVTHRNKYAERQMLMLEFMRDTIRHKLEVAAQFDLKRKHMETLLREMHEDGLIKIMMAKQYPWRAAIQYYYSADSDMDKVYQSKELVESKYAGIKKDELAVEQQVFIKEPEIPELPNNLLAMMGYTTHKPEGGKQFNLDEYSASHPDWNKYQARQGVQYSNIGCAMQMMIESAPGTI